MAHSDTGSITPLVLVDGHNLLWRAAFGFPARIKSRNGIDRTAEFGFFALLRAATKQISEPAEWVVCFDGQFGLEKRLTEYSEYKGKRAPIGDGSPIKALPHIKAGLEHAAIDWIELEESEADDVIATLVENQAGRPIYVMSTDKDFYQLVDNSVHILNTARKRIVGIVDILQRYGVTPRQWCDFRALTGDPADNISGIPGIGPRTAATLLSDGAVLEDLEHLGRLGGRIGERLRGGWEELIRDRELVRLRQVSNVPVVITALPNLNWLTPAAILEHLRLW